MPGYKILWQLHTLLGSNQFRFFDLLILETMEIDIRKV